MRNIFSCYMMPLNEFYFNPLLKHYYGRKKLSVCLSN